MPPKKPARHHQHKHERGKDLRRAFEHLSRVHLLRPAIVSAHAQPIDILVTIAQQQLHQNHDKQAADLLRAAEHLSFAALPAEHPGQPKLSKDLVSAIREQFAHLQAKSLEHWEQDSRLSDIYHSISQQAGRAFENGEYHQALEWQRAAEALARVKLHRSHAIAGGPEPRQLAASRL